MIMVVEGTTTVVNGNVIVCAKLIKSLDLIISPLKNTKVISNDVITFQMIYLRRQVTDYMKRKPRYFYKHMFS